ncbi:hypothetical protein Tco_0039890 [Tanacetum coccineum]
MERPADLDTAVLKESLSAKPQLQSQTYVKSNYIVKEFGRLLEDQLISGWISADYVKEYVGVFKGQSAVAITPKLSCLPFGRTR